MCPKVLSQTIVTFSLHLFSVHLDLVKLKLIKCSTNALDLSGLHIVIMLSQLSWYILVFKGRNNLKNVVYIQLTPFYMVWANLPRPMGECAPVWGKLAHLESTQKSNIYSELY